MSCSDGLVVEMEMISGTIKLYISYHLPFPLEALDVGACWSSHVVDSYRCFDDDLLGFDRVV